MKSFVDFYKDELVEVTRDDIICRCHQVTAGELLDLAKFNQSATEDELLKSLKVGTSCGQCKRKNCADKKKCTTHYSKVLRKNISL